MICPHCQAINADGSLYCGNCGQPLPVAAPQTQPQSYDDSPPAWSQTPTQPGRAVAPAMPQPGHSLYAPPYATPYAPSPPTAATATRARPRVGCLIGAGVAILVVLIGWFGIARPALRRATDNALNSAIASAAQAIPAVSIPSGQHGHFRITDTDLNNLIRQNLGDTGPIGNVSAQFTTGAIVVHFSTLGIGDHVTIHLADAGTGIQISEITEDGPVGLILDPQELFTPCQNALATIQEKLKGLTITSLTITPGVLLATF